MYSFDSAGSELVDRSPALEVSLRMPLFPNRTVPHYLEFYFRLMPERRRLGSVFPPVGS